MSLQDDLANEAIKDLDEYLDTQPIELAGRAWAYELFHKCLQICAKWDLKPDAFADRCRDEARKGE